MESKIQSSGPMTQFLPGLSSSTSTSIDLTSSPSSPQLYQYQQAEWTAERPYIFGTTGRRSFMRDRIDGNATTVDVVMPCLPVKQLQINENILMRNTQYLIPERQLTWIDWLGNRHQIFEYSASNIRTRLVKPESGSLKICQTRIDFSRTKYSKCRSLSLEPLAHNCS